MGYDQWLSVVTARLRQARHDVPVEAIDPNALYRAYLSGMHPLQFADQPILPIRPQVVTIETSTRSGCNPRIPTWVAVTFILVNVIGLIATIMQKYPDAFR